MRAKVKAAFLFYCRKIIDRNLNPNHHEWIFQLLLHQQRNVAWTLRHRQGYALVPMCPPDICSRGGTCRSVRVAILARARCCV